MGYENLIVVLVAQCVALPVRPHTKLSDGLKDQEQHGVTGSPAHHFHARVTPVPREHQLS